MKPTERAPTPSSAFLKEDARLNEAAIEATRQAILEVLRFFHGTPDGPSYLPKGLPANVTKTMATRGIAAWINTRVAQARGRQHPGYVESLIYGLEFEDKPVECPTCCRPLEAPAPGVFD